MTEYSELQKFMRVWRLKNNVTVGDMSRAIGVRKGTIYDIEKYGTSIRNCLKYERFCDFDEKEKKEFTIANWRTRGVLEYSIKNVEPDKLGLVYEIIRDKYDANDDGMY